MVILSKKSSFVSLDQIAQETKMSRRVVDYNYRRLNIMLEKLQLSQLIAVPSKGILMPAELIKWFNELTSDFRNNVEYLYSREERLAYCMSLIIIGRRAYNIDSLAESLNVNRSTIYSDLRRVKKEVEQCGGELTHDKYYKYYIKATGRDYVRMLQKSADILLEALPEELLSMVINEQVADVIQRFIWARKEGILSSEWEFDKLQE